MLLCLQGFHLTLQISNNGLLICNEALK